jgi:hypothetical protein
MSFFGHEEPLGMPKGSVRALLLLGLLGLIAAVQVIGLELIPVVGEAFLVVAGYYVGRRSAEDENGQ